MTAFSYKFAKRGLCEPGALMDNLPYVRQLDLMLMTSSIAHHIKNISPVIMK